METLMAVAQEVLAGLITEFQLALARAVRKAVAKLLKRRATAKPLSAALAGAALKEVERMSVVVIVSAVLTVLAVHALRKL